MSRAPIRFRTFILGAILVVLLVPTLAASAAWLIERENQHSNIQHRVDTAVSFLNSHRSEIKERATLRQFERTLAPLDLRAELVIATQTPPDKVVLFVNASLEPPEHPTRGQAESRGGTRTLIVVGPRTTRHSHCVVEAPATLTATLFYRHASSGARLLVAFITWVVIFLASLDRGDRSGRTLDGHAPRSLERSSRQGRGRRSVHRGSSKSDRRDREHCTGGRRHDDRPRRDRTKPRRSG